MLTYLFLFAEESKLLQREEEQQRYPVNCLRRRAESSEMDHTRWKGIKTVVGKAVIVIVYIFRSLSLWEDVKWEALDTADVGFKSK